MKSEIECDSKVPHEITKFRAVLLFIIESSVPVPSMPEISFSFSHQYYCLLF